VELYLTGRSRIFNEQAVKIVIISITHCSGNTHVRRGPTKNEVLDTFDAQHETKVGVLKGTATRLVNDILARQGI